MKLHCPTFEKQILKQLKLNSAENVRVLCTWCEKKTKFHRVWVNFWEIPRKTKNTFLTNFFVSWKKMFVLVGCNFHLFTELLKFTQNWQKNWWKFWLVFSYTFSDLTKQFQKNLFEFSSLSEKFGHNCGLIFSHIISQFLESVPDQRFRKSRFCIFENKKFWEINSC